MLRNALFLALALTGCAGGLSQMPGTPPVPALTISYQDAGRAVDLEAGRKLTIQLPANHSEGYRWFLAASGGPLEQYGEPFYTEDRPVAGANGAEYWSFVGKGAGSEELRFEYRRPWEKDKPAARTLDYKINVR